MELALEYRPETLSEVCGNAALKSTLGAILKRKHERIPHTFLFTGPRGCGKTTLGRIVANAIKCDPSEFNEVDVAEFNGVGDAREIKRKMMYKPMQGKVRVWFMDEVHNLTAQAQEALLKATEEPPDHVYFICSTTDPQKLKQTFKDRFTTFEVKPLTKSETIEMLEETCEAEGKDVPDDVLKHIAQCSDGHPRAALKQLERVLDLPKKEMLQAAAQTLETENITKDLIQALIKKESWKTVSGILKNLTDPPETIRYAVLGYCNAMLLNADNPRVWLIMDTFINNTYDSGKSGITHGCYQIINS